VVSRRQERELSERIAAEVNLAPTMLKQRIADLSGGNQQKVVFGRFPGAIAPLPAAV